MYCMLVLTRKLNERIMIGDDIVITFIELRGDNSIRLGIEAPRGVRIQREEIVDAVTAANRSAAEAGAGAEASLKKMFGEFVPPTGKPAADRAPEPGAANTAEPGADRAPEPGAAHDRAARPSAERSPGAQRPADPSRKPPLPGEARPGAGRSR